VKPVLHSYVVFDPTGRGLESSMEVGQVMDVIWASEDDGDASGHPRPLLKVLPNGSAHHDGAVLVTTVESVLRLS
jgi:hypothetical protein